MRSVDMWNCNATGNYSSFTGLSPNIPFPTPLVERDLDMAMRLESRICTTDHTTFLRGMWPTDRREMMDMKTILPWKGQLCFTEELKRQIMALEPYALHMRINRTTDAHDTVYFQGAEGGLRV
ncbi:hypothetical protein BDW75DRAFT_239460 [Aspergillus navahoensis]